MNNSAEQSELDRFVERHQATLKHITLYRFIWLLIFVCAFIAWNRGIALLYGLLAVLLALLIVSHWFSYKSVIGIKIKRIFPSVVEANKLVELIYQIEAKSTKRFLLITEQPDEFIKLFVQAIRKNQQLTIQSSFPKRGIYQFKEIQISSAYPFGLVNTQKTIITEPAEVCVLPERFAVSSLPVFSAKSAASGQIESSYKGMTENFAGIRQYRHGDSLKIVHWSASARQASKGKDWVVKTFESFDNPRLLIIINQSLTGEAFEKMLSIAASVSYFAINQGITTKIVGENKQGIWQIEIPPEPNLFVYYLKQLAALNTESVNYARSIDYSQLHCLQENIIMTFATEEKKSDSAATSQLINCSHLEVLFSAADAKKPVFAGNASHYCYRINPDLHSLAQISGLFI